MTEYEYQAWAKGYARTFGLNDTAAAAVANWGDWLAVECGATPERLAAATRHAMARRPWPKPHDAAEHMAAIRDGLRTARETEQQDRAADRGDTGGSRCEVCDGTGVALVPHPRDVRAGRWEPAGEHRTGRPRFRTAGLPCVCAPTALAHARTPSMTLTAYERLNPRWREQVRDRDELERKRLRDINAAYGITAAGPTADTVAAGMPAPDDAMGDAWEPEAGHGDDTQTRG